MSEPCSNSNLKRHVDDDEPMDQDPVNPIESCGSDLSTSKRYRSIEDALCTGFGLFNLHFFVTLW